MPACEKCGSTDYGERLAVKTIDNECLVVCWPCFEEVTKEWDVDDDQ
jgi:hypothetical protein